MPNNGRITVDDVTAAFDEVPFNQTMYNALEILAAKSEGFSDFEIMDALQLGAQGTALQGQDMSLLREDMFNVPYVEEASTRQTRVGRVEQLFKLHDIAREYLDETRQAERLVAAALSRITGTPSRTRQASAGTGAPAGASAAEKSRRGPSR